MKYYIVNILLLVTVNSFCQGFVENNFSIQIEKSANGKIKILEYDFSFYSDSISQLEGQIVGQRYFKGSDVFLLKK
jgi:hypothetical protein